MMEKFILSGWKMGEFISEDFYGEHAAYGCLNREYKNDQVDGFTSCVVKTFPASLQPFS
jgi:hypothetical protein